MDDGEDSTTRRAPPIPPIKKTNDGNSDKYFVKLKLRKDPISPTSDLYEVKIAFFDNGECGVTRTKTLNIDYIIWILAQYPHPVNYLSKEKCAMHHVMKKTHSLTVRRYAARLIDINEYSMSFPGANLNDKIGGTK